MARIDDLYAVYEAELNLIKQQSSLLLQKRTDGFGGELKTSGTIVENYIKGFLSKNLSTGFRVCSGYIATAETISGSDNLIQHDIIIVDDRYPTLHKFGVSDIEIVPAEAVCGIIEAKRTLTAEAIKSAIRQLNTTRSILDKYDNGIKKKNNENNNLAGPQLSVATAAPFYGIIGLSLCNKTVDASFISDTIVPEIVNFVDIIWPLADPWLMQFSIVDNASNPFTPIHVSRNQDEYKNKALILMHPNTPARNIYGIGISCLREWIRNSSGLPINYDKSRKYFGII